jgi:hypothetical protein
MAGSGRKNADTALLAALAAGLTVSKAAAKAGVSERTAYRRLEDPDFRSRLGAARAAMLDRALGQLTEGSVRAAATLRKLLKSYSPAVQLGAARAILSLGQKLTELVELEARMRALEEQVAGSGANARR